MCRRSNKYRNNVNRKVIFYYDFKSGGKRRGNFIHNKEWHRSRVSIHCYWLDLDPAESSKEFHKPK